MKCSMCEKGELKKGKVKEYMFGKQLGEFPALVCFSCGESFTDCKTTKNILKAAVAVQTRLGLGPSGCRVGRTK